jgi:adenosylcobinamide-phosphate synthase
MATLACALSVRLEKPGVYALNPDADLPTLADGERAVTVVGRAAVVAVVVAVVLAVIVSEFSGLESTLGSVGELILAVIGGPDSDSILRRITAVSAK